MDKPLETLGQPCLAQLDARELATVLAGLRQRQQAIDDSDYWILPGNDNIASDGGRLEPLTAAEIDALCERLNAGPLDRQPPDSTALALLKEIVDDASPCQTAGNRLVDETLIENAQVLLSQPEVTQ